MLFNRCEYFAVIYIKHLQLLRVETTFAIKLTYGLTVPLEAFDHFAKANIRNQLKSMS